MFIGRKDELGQLEEIYKTDHSNLLVLYGRSRIGKTALAEKFSQDKSCIMYLAQECTQREQSSLLSHYLKRDVKEGYEVLLDVCRESSSDKKQIIIIDEFQYMAEDDAFAELLIKLFAAAGSGEFKGGVMVILISSSINWVENSMVGTLGIAARLITGYLKLGELGFADLVEWFGKSSVADCIMIKAVCGAVPGYLVHWQENRRIRENIIALLLSKDSVLENEVQRLLRCELRELAAYNSILAALASGKLKLNDIYAETGFSRAKISVYIKNLIQMDIVEKVYSYDKTGHENLQKGLYRIKDSFINFYYAFVFRNKAALHTGDAKAVYDTCILPVWEGYLRNHFADVCREYLELMSRYGRLKHKYESFYEWHGKAGTIDIVAEAADGSCLAAQCLFTAQQAGGGELELLRELAQQAGINPSQIYMFARAGFDKELTAIAKDGSQKVNLVALSDL